MSTRLVVFYTAAALVALLSSLLFTPLLRSLAVAGGLVDVSDGRRKLHERAIPPVGGMTIALAIGLALLATTFASVLGLQAPRPAPDVLRILMGAGAMLVLGSLDDLRAMRARYKLLGQAVIATAVYASGFHVGAVTILGHPMSALAAPAAAALTVLWLVGVTNAFNLIDGVDGLAPGAAAIGLAAVTVIGAVNHHWAMAWVTGAFCAATIGVRRYNVHPASVFLGDAGSLMLGFVLASSVLVAGQRSGGGIDALVPVIVLGLPILDTSVAIARRFLRGQPIFAPDRGHIHHRLLNRGHSPRETASALCRACALLAAGGVAVNAWPVVAPEVLVVLGLAAVWFVQQLRIDEFEELAESFARGAAQRQGIQRSVRLREACLTLATSNDVTTSLNVLADTLCGIGIERGEIRLREDFLHGVHLHTSAGDLVDETVVWCCGRPTAHDDAWQISFPLFTAGRDRVGSLTLWQPVRKNPESLGHWRVIGQQLCTAIAPRLSTFSRTTESTTTLHIPAKAPVHPTHGAA